jgi:beta-glucosidase
MWSTVAVERLGIPKVRVTDGPNGARGAALPGEVASTSTCVPCGTALGATWNPQLVARVGEALGSEARSKGCHVLLAPTVNIHRSPLAGRNFECYSEDPLLSGVLGAAFVRGAQSRGVATTVKHFVGNDAEFERYTMSSKIDERPLREIYLLPFELVVRDGGSLGVMTGYNRLDGTWCSEHHELLRDILRGEWRFDGFVISDWFAAASTVASARAGLDLEMPGPGRAFGPAVAAAVRADELEETTLDEQVERLLALFERVGAFDDVEPKDGASPDTPEHRALALQAATEAMVLLKNEGVLPLATSSLRSVAVVGQNAGRAVIMGGGSSQVQPPYRTTPLDALREHLGGAVSVVFEPGVDIDTTVAVLSDPMTVEVFDGSELNGNVVATRDHPNGEILFFGPPVRSLTEPFSFRARATVLPPDTGTYVFTLVQVGRARLLVDGATLLDGLTDPPPRGASFFGLGSEEMTATVELTAGRAVEIEVQYSSDTATAVYAVKLGFARRQPVDAMDRAVAVAAGADAAVVVVGTTNEWESEGHDRASMDLPGDQDELVARVVAANPNTVVVVNAGSPVAMPWAGQARAVVQVWFGGQEMSQALARVLTGHSEPGGRLPTTFPLRLEHNPSYGNFPGENDEVHYGEGVLVGYRWYEARHLPVRFPFGHGLSYTTFAIGEPRPSTTSLAVGGTLTLDVAVTNVGDRAGSEVVQCYVAPSAPRLTRPPKELKAFAKVHLEPGESTVVSLVLDRRAFAYWDPGSPEHDALVTRRPFMAHGGQDTTAPAPGWRIDPGRYELHVGRSSADIAHVVAIDLSAP